jgi:hypothetical protein
VKFLVFFLLLSFHNSFAQTSSPAPSTEGSEVVPDVIKPKVSPIEKTVDEASVVKEEPANVPVVEEVKKGALTSRENRHASTGTFMLGYQFLTTWVPSKLTASYTQIFNEEWSVEAEYSKGSLAAGFGVMDFANVKESRVTIQARRYTGNSFNFTFGPVLSSFSAHAGNDMVSEDVSSEFSASNLGITTGMGNRWQWSNGFAFGIDWVRVNIPLIETKIEDDVLDSVSQSEDSEDIKKVIRAFNRVPTFVLLGLNIGYTF